MLILWFPKINYSFNSVVYMAVFTYLNQCKFVWNYCSCYFVLYVAVPSPERCVKTKTITALCFILVLRPFWCVNAAPARGRCCVWEWQRTKVPPLLRSASSVRRTPVSTPARSSRYPPDNCVWLLTVWSAAQFIDLPGEGVWDSGFSSGFTTAATSC